MAVKNLLRGTGGSWQLEVLGFIGISFKGSFKLWWVYKFIAVQVRV